MKELMIKAIPRAIAEVSQFDEALEDLPTRQSYVSRERHTKISAEVLADRFRIGLDKAKRTSKITLQRGTRSALLPSTVFEQQQGYHTNRE